MAADKAKSVTFKANVAAAVLDAATNSRGYSETTGSEHATYVRTGVVRVEYPEDGSRKTVTVKIPETLSFEIVE